MLLRVYQDMQPPVPKGNSKFKNVLSKIFNLKQKANTSCYYRKNQTLSLQEDSL